MQKFREPFVYRLQISNLTRRDLLVAARQLNHGLWCREGVDGQIPIDVPAGATVEALGIRASTTNTKGYEFRCSWESRRDDRNQEGALTLFVSVPFVGAGNRAGLDVSGCFKVEGWTGVLTIGHQFEHTLTVTCIV